MCLPACLPACVRVCLPACPLARLPACLQGLKAKTAAMLPEVGKAKGKGRGKAAAAAAAAAADDDEEMTEAVVGDAEGGAALAEEAAAPATQRVSCYGSQ